MEKIKSMLHGKKEGETHHPGDPEYDASKEARGDKGDEGYGLNDSANSKGHHEGYTRDASDPSLLTGAVGAKGPSQHPDNEIHLGDSRGKGEKEMEDPYRTGKDMGTARRGVEDREAMQQREMDSSSRQNPSSSLESSAGQYSSTGGQGLQYMDAAALGTGTGAAAGGQRREMSSGTSGRQVVGENDASATGLEQRDGYAAGAQAGGLLNKEDIRRMDREDQSGRSAGGVAPQIGGSPESGFTSRQMGGAGGQMSGVDERMASSGYGGPEARTEQVMTGAGSAGSYASEPEAGTSGLRVEEGLIHGHHTTITGENLDPHMKR